MARGIRERATVEDVAIFLSMGVMIAISRSGAANEKARDAEINAAKTRMLNVRTIPELCVDASKAHR